ncbi:MAG: transcription-repair coupling factor [Peptostreptococcaceae bacterium]|nr:transcription-repair coupling factor [Peptostreptococcaceae bacterium]
MGKRVNQTTIERIQDFLGEYQDLKDTLVQKDHILLTGLHSGQRTELALYLYHCGYDPCLVCYSDREADEAYRAITRSGIRPVLLKSQDIRFYSIEAKNRTAEGELIEGLFTLLKQERVICIVTAEALMKKYVPKQELAPLYLQVEVGKTLDVDDFVQKLVGMGYVREHKVEGVGMFAVRGGILDIFSPSMTHPLRIELFDDEVDSIRSFDIYTQKSIEKYQQADIIPSRSFLLPKEDAIQKAVERMRLDMQEHTSADIAYDIDRMQRRQYFEGIEKYIDYFYPTQNTIFDYLKKDCLFILNEPSRIIERMEGAFEEYKESFLYALEKGFAIQGQGNLLLSKDEVIDHLHQRKKIYNTLIASSVGGMKTDAILSIETRESRAFHGKLMEFLEEIKYLRHMKYMILIALKDENLIRGIRKLLSDHDIPSGRIDEGSIEYQVEHIVFTNHDLVGGSIYTKGKLAIFTKDEIYSPQKSNVRKFAPKVKTKKIESFIELKAGDYVVHEEYGIGRFVAVEQRNFDEITKDYIKISYFGGDSLYLPLDQMAKIQRYIGNMKEDGIKLSKMGGNEWKTTKKRAKRVVELIAQDLVELYAKRENQKGFQFSEDSAWQQEFESDFPFVETNDQLRAIQEVKTDMQSDRIMDRLLCGDVGYGKTEVALRAVFKAAIDSKQSAFLVPTTVLAQQHYNTFKERFRNFPIRVESLSRFRTASDQKNVIEQLRTGEVDVLIGTHRILSKDIDFKDLGLIVIDEEQRFGVKDKEKLKKIRNNCDVLSLSATPIPRTLHMSLSGIRDITTLEEPPKERRAVLTYVMEAREGIITDAILREVQRGGQVYFVYNRVQTIDAMYDKLSKLLPDVRIAVGHGQMSSRKLEKVLTDFTNKEYDVLLCTTIIETGMDIGNANTIIVYGADRMGLSQLYQLRGRVGRTSRQGYAYFMYEKDKILTEVAEKRLATIKEFTEFGSGFKVAMRDLEIRGAGTLLGETQHGHIADIGYELYVKMLDQEIRRLRGEEIEEEFETEINIRVNAYIPSEYIENEMDKIEIYKKIASIRDLEDKYNIEEEMEDRFSDIPYSVYALTDVAYIRALGKKLRIGKISQIDGKILFYSTSGTLIVKKDFGKQNEYKLLKNIANYLEKMV